MSKLLQRALAIHSAPALCGIKASNLVCIEYSDDLIKNNGLYSRFVNDRKEAIGFKI